MRTAGVNFLILFWRKLKNISNKFASRKDIFTIIWAGKWREVKHGKGKRGWDLIRGWRKIIMRKQNKKWKVRRGKKPKERTSCAAAQEEHHLAFLHCKKRRDELQHHWNQHLSPTPKYGKHDIKSKQQALHDCFTEEGCRLKSNS